METSHHHDLDESSAPTQEVQTPRDTVVSHSVRLAIASLLTACGGGSDGPSSLTSNASNAPFQALFSRSLAEPGVTPKAVTTPTADEFMDWAEAAYPAYFPGHQVSQTQDTLRYRYYPQAGNYLAVSGDTILALGPVSGNQVVTVGTVSQFADTVRAWQSSGQVASDAEAARFLHQAQFSASDSDIAAVRQLGYAGWLNQQFATPSSISCWDWLIAHGYNDAIYLNSSVPVDYMIWYQLMATPDTVRQRVALALSEIMVTSIIGVSISYRSFAMAAWWDTLKANAFGNYRTLLEAVTLNPAMGVYLNMKGSQKEDAASGRQPDENYAREVMQLFSIGLYQLNPDGSVRTGANGQPLETYDQSTVTNLARVFTGWDFNNSGTSASNPVSVRNPMTLIPSRHSTQSATFLGVTIPANTDGNAALRIALDTLFNHPNVGPFFGRQLIQRLVTSNPSPAYIARVSAAFANNGAGVRGDLQAVVRAVLLDPEARSAASTTQPTWGKLREPIVRLTQWARTFKASSATGDWKVGDMSSDSSRLGQSPLHSPSVFNFFRPNYVPPNTSLATSGLVAPEFQLANESTIAGYINYLQSIIPVGIADVVPDYSSELALAANPAALVDRLNLLLCSGQLSATNVAAVRDAITTINASTTTGQKNRVYAAILLIMASPQFIVQK